MKTRNNNNLNENLRVSAIFHNKEEQVPEEVTQKMWMVLIAAIPVALVSGYIFGMNVYLIMGLSILFCVVFEGIFNKLTHITADKKDISPVITGLLLAFLLPANIPIYVLITGCFVSVIVIKKILGGLGHNMINPALGGWLFLMSIFPVEMNNYPNTAVSSVITEEAAMTPWQMIISGNEIQLPSNIEMFLGFVPGGLGTVSAVAIIAGGIFLLVKKVISLIVPLVYIISVCGFSFAFGINPVFQITSGIIYFVAFFALGDPSTMPNEPLRKGLSAFFCALVTVLGMVSEAPIESALLAVIILNIFSTYIDQLENRNLNLDKKIKFNLVKRVERTDEQ